MRWVALSVTLLMWGLTWPQVLPREADLPPCHMMLLISLAGVWTLIEFIKDRIARQRVAQVGHCFRCGYNLTGNTTGRCPECGQLLSR